MDEHTPSSVSEPATWPGGDDFVRVLLDSTAEAFYAVNPQGVTTLCNDAFLKMLGFTSKQEVIGRKLHDVIHHSHPDGAPYPSADCPIYRAASRGQPAIVSDEVFFRRDGSAFPVEYRAAPIIEAGELQGAICTFIDITDRRASEAILKRSAAWQAFRVDLSDALRGLSDAETIMQVAAERLGVHLGVDQANFYLIEPGAIVVSREWRTAASSGLTGRFQLAGLGPDLTASLERGETLRLDDTRGLTVGFAAAGMMAVVSAPVRAEGRWVGGLHVHQAAPRVWLDEEVALIGEVAERGWAEIRRARAIAALKASEAQFRTFAEAAPNHVWTAPPDGLLDWFNARVYEYGGMRPGELDGEGWARLVHPDDIDPAVERWTRALASGEPYETEFRLRRADGAFRWHLARAVAILNEQGAIVRWVGTNTDIDDQKAAAHALAHLNATLEQRVAERTADRDRLWRNAQDLLTVAGPDGRIRAANPAWTTVLGWPEDQVIGRSYHDFILEEDHAAGAIAIGEAARGPLQGYEVRLRHQDGSLRWIAWVARPEDGLIYAAGRDITAQKQQAEALTAAEDALRQSQKMEAVGQLTGGIAHDFNNMLAVVIGSLDLLSRRIGGGDARARRYADAAAEGARRAALLTQRLLAFSRQQALRPQILDVNTLVSGMSDLLRHSLGAEIRLESVLAGGVWRVNADPNQLENALLNLAVNARDAMIGGGRLTIETQNARLDERYVASHLGVAAGQYVMIAVTDTGGGMTADVIAKVFDPFFTTKGAGKGTGLGLSQVYGFVKQSGGHVKIYSEPGQGTTVKIYLPRVAAPAHSTDDFAPDTDLPLGDHQEVVLVVEDEPAVRQFSVDALTELGYQVLEADGAVVAMEILQAHPQVALLFTDVVMPDVNGRKLADEARKHRPDLKILFTTGYTRNAVVHNGVLDPDVELISKPYTVEELAAKVRDVLDAG